MTFKAREAAAERLAIGTAVIGALQHPAKTTCHSAKRR